MTIGVKIALFVKKTPSVVHRSTDRPINVHRDVQEVNVTVRALHRWPYEQHARVIASGCISEWEWFCRSLLFIDSWRKDRVIASISHGGQTINEIVFGITGCTCNQHICLSLSLAYSRSLPLVVFKSNMAELWEILAKTENKTQIALLRFHQKLRSINFF